MRVDAPLALCSEAVRPEWIDYNGHMNVAYYMLAFDHATDALLDYLGMDAGYRERTHCTVYTLEAHIVYERELKEGDPLRITTQLLDHDPKRVHYFHHMYHAEEGYLAATNELIIMHIDMRVVRGSAMPEDVLTRLEAVMTAHRSLPRPPQVGRTIGILRR
jgi:acyl-CoA thioester hydrolase